MGYMPIVPWKSLRGNGAHPVTQRLLEDETETFKKGTPVVVTNGYLIESPTIDSALKIAGFSQEPAANLTVQGVPEHLTQGDVENQPNAVIIPGGVKMNDGRCGVWIADDQTVFIGQVKSDQTPAQTDIGVIYGLTKDGTSGQWFVDKTITAAGSGAICEVVAIPAIPGDPYAPVDAPVANGKIAFKITKAGQQFSI